MTTHAARFALPLAAASAVFVLPSLQAHALGGHLAYLKDGQARVMNMATGSVQSVAGGQNVDSLFLAPQGGRLLLFRSQYAKGATTPRAVMALPPYKTVTPLPAPLNTLGVNQVSWTRDGSRALVVGFVGSAQRAYLVRFVPALEGNALAYAKRRGMSAFTVTSLPAGDEGTLSGDGRYYGYAPNGDVKVRDLRIGKDVTLLAWKKPAPVLAAIKGSANPKKMSDLLSAYDPEYARENRNWANGGLTFSRDGKTLFFASNAGTTSGAAGNTTFAYFAGNISTGKLLPLSKIGAEFGRIPHIAQVSPDGLRMIYGTSAHSSAIDNPVFIDSIYLPTQTATTILTVPAKGPVDSNLEDGAAWSPDSRSVAVASYFYNTTTLGDFYANHPNYEVPPSKFTLNIKDAASGKVLKSIAGAIRPSWGQ